MTYPSNPGIDECHQYVLCIWERHREEVTGPAFMVLENNIGFEEGVDGRTPMLLECL